MSNPNGAHEASPQQDVDMSSSISAEETMPTSKLESLPRNLLGQVASYLVVDGNGIGRDPSAMLPLLKTSKAIYSALTFDEFPQLYHDLFCATFDHAALTRRFNWMAATMAASRGAGGGAKPPGPGGDGKGKKMFKLFDDPRSWAIEYRNRWGMARRMKAITRHGKLYVQGLCDKEQAIADMWNIWFLLTENDGKNVSFLAHQCDFRNWMVLYYKDDMLQDSLVPGYPKDTGDKALGMWCSLLSGTDLSAVHTPADVDEKIFTLRPYVFACAKYDITYAPWHHRRLPLADPTAQAPGPPPAENDITLRSKAIPYGRFGYTWRRAPPHFVLGAYLVFFRLLERQPQRTDRRDSTTSTSSNGSTMPAPGLFSVSHLLPSIYHDREWQRNSVCQDPHSSPGLPALTFHGDMTGYWRGKFLFYDFEMYRQILAGDMRAVYTGNFAEQTVEMELKETLVRIKKEDVGGQGLLLSAGFRDPEGMDPEEEQRRIEAGYGSEIARSNEPDEVGWTKEILISGKCRSDWGWAWVRGRIRSWDGLVILAIEYPHQAMGKWLWRGYLHTGGHLLGRWRDSFTDENLRGYEGAFGMIRAGDISWPAQYSANSNPVQGQQAAAPQTQNGYTAASTTV